MGNNTAFTTDKFETAYPIGDEFFYWNIARNKIIEQTLVKHNLQKSNILEIGCGRGGVVSYLNDQKFKIEGVELAKVEPFEKVKHIVKADFNAFELPYEIKAKYQTILLLDVIEHIQDPQKFLAEVTSNFPNIENLLITVPACSELWSNYDVHYGHYMRYDLLTLNKLIAKANFKLIWGSYFFHSLFFPAYVIKKLGFKRSVLITAPKGINKLINKMLGSFFILDFKIFPEKAKGTSIIFLVNKLPGSNNLINS